MAKICFSCKKALDISGAPGRGESCEFCDSDLKACLNCKFFDASSYNDPLGL